MRLKDYAGVLLSGHELANCYKFSLTVTLTQNCMLNVADESSNLDSNSLASPF